MAIRTMAITDYGVPERLLQGMAELSRYSTRRRSPRAEERACTC